MLNKFKKKLAGIEAKGPEENLQDIQKTINEKILHLGDYEYKKHTLHRELNSCSEKIHSLTQELDKLIEKGVAIRNRIQEEMNAKIAEGKANEASKVDQGQS
jgi:hypothetical protein